MFLSRLCGFSGKVFFCVVYLSWQQLMTQSALLTLTERPCFEGDANVSPSTEGPQSSCSTQHHLEPAYDLTVKKQDRQTETQQLDGLTGKQKIPMQTARV